MKKATVIWSANALKDLDIVFEFHAEKSLKAAEKIISSLLARTEQLETFPESGKVEELISSSKTYRYVVEGDYKLIYSFSSGIVYVHTVFDCRQNPVKMKVNNP